jgi:hypothetical protein
MIKLASGWQQVIVCVVCSLRERSTGLLILHFSLCILHSPGTEAPA